jgi:5-methylcytosine-specific restriction endonuclease McrA
VATKRQRRAIHLRQRGRCANRGCHHPIGEVHHVIDWAYGGKTHLNNLAGLCRKCHALITTGRLATSGTFDTGYTFTAARAGPLARTG